MYERLGTAGVMIIRYWQHWSAGTGTNGLAWGFVLYIPLLARLDLGILSYFNGNRSIVLAFFKVQRQVWFRAKGSFPARFQLGVVFLSASASFSWTANGRYLRPRPLRR